MSDLTASHCGCGSNNNSNSGCSSINWIIILLAICGNKHGDNDCGCGGFLGGFGNGDNNCCELIILLVILSCCCGGNGFC